jgi:hypothetical protein
MRKELEQKRVARWPDWSGLAGNPRLSPMARGFEHSDGWYSILWRLCADVDKGTWRKRVRRTSSLRSKRELRITPGFQAHEALWAAAKKLRTDFEPHGNRKRSGWETQRLPVRLLVVPCPGG